MAQDRRQEGPSIRELGGLLERLGHGALFWSLDLRVVASNRLAGQFYGLGDRLRPGMSYYELLEALPPGGVMRTSPVQDWRPLSTPDPPATVLPDFERGQVFEMHFPGPPPRTVISNRAILRDGILASVTTDITDREEVAAAVARERERLAAIVDNLREGVILCDVEGRVLAFNRQALDHFAIPHGALREGDHVTRGLELQRVLDRLPPEERERRRAEWLAFATGKSDRPVTGRRELGDGRVLEVTRTPLGDGTLFVYHDVTAEEERRALHEQARREAEEASRMKSEFLARVSHELRTPMQGVLGMAAILARTELDAQQRRAVEVIRSSGAHLLRLIEDLLTVSALEAGGLSLHPVPLPLAQPLGEAVDIMRPQAEERGLSLRFDPRPLDGVVVRVDPTRLRQILINLLDNALRHTASGGVLVTASATPAGDGKRHAVEIAVADTGPGIPPGMEEAIFRRFHQLAPAPDAVSQGIGIGLPMARGLARLMGGDVTVESPADGGAVFTLRLELPRARSG